MERKTNTCAIVGFILSFFVGLAGLIVSIVALNQIKKRNEKGKGLAIAGVVFSILGIIPFLVGLFFMVFIIPGLNNSIETSTICNNGPGITIGEVGEPGFVTCDSVSSDGTYVCEYVNADNHTRFVTCSTSY